jgi:hypothetical protein
MPKFVNVFFLQVNLNIYELETLDYQKIIDIG